MKILIFGAKGNLGSQLNLAARVIPGANVEAWDREEINVLDFPALRISLDKAAPEFIFNAIAYNAVDKCEEDELERDLAFKLNRDLPKELAGWALDHGAVLVHYSSDYVFSGRIGDVPFSENAEPAPVNSYGESKLAGEREILSAGAIGLRFYLIRTSKLFGPKGESQFAKPSFFDIMLALAQDKKEIRAVDSEHSCFTYTPDLAAATISLALSDSTSGIYHLINEGVATWYQAARELFILRPQSGLSLVAAKPEDFPRPAKRPEFSALANNLAPKLRSWQDALYDYLKNINI